MRIRTILNTNKYLKRRYSTIGAEILVKQLQYNGCKDIFLYSGGANLAILDQIKKHNINSIMNINEQCCGHSAAGYSKSSNKIGVVLSTSGPGVTNLITPVLDAKNDSVPLIVLTGQVPTTALGTNAFQECPSVDLMKTITKKSTQIKHIKDIKKIIDEAYYLAANGKPGPVHIDCPKDIMSELINNDKLNNISSTFKKPLYKKKLDIKKLNKVLNLISISKKPIIIAGNGGVNYNNLIRDLSYYYDIPVTTTIHGLGIVDEENDLSLKMLGMHGSAAANYAVQEADLIVAIGYRFCDRTTGNLKDYALNAKQAELEERGGIIHFNIDDKEFNRVVKSTINISGNCRDNLKWLLNNSKKKNNENWTKKIVKLKNKYKFNYDLNNNNEIKTQSVIDTFYHKTKHLDNILITTGVGNHQMMTAQFYRWKYTKRMITSGSLGTMGVGLPFAIGSSIANPSYNVFCIDGDGSFNMTSNDLSTLAKLKLPIKIFIMNDGKQQMVNIWQNLFFDSNYIATDNNNPNYCNLAKSYGIKSYRVENKKKLNEILDKVIYEKEPIIIDFKVTPDICLPLIPPGNSLSDMILKKEENLNINGLAPS